MNAQSLLVLTCTVTPQTGLNLVRTDPLARRAAYIRSIRFWGRVAEALNHDMLVVENSGHCWDLALEAGAAQERIHTLSYAEDSPLTQQGKGAGEALMYDRIADWLTGPAREYVSLTKVTGQLTLRNPRASLRQMPAGPHLRCLLRLNLTKMDTRIWGADVGTFGKYFTGMADEVDEHHGIDLETVACRRALSAVVDGVPRPEFRFAPVLRGVSGSTGARLRGLRTAGGSAVVWAGRRLGRLDYV
jgi:hypothetical protein